MSLKQALTDGDYYGGEIVEALTSKPVQYGPLPGKYANQARHVKTNEAVTKIGPVKGHYDPQLMALLAGELV